MLFSTFATPFAATIYGVLALYIGHSLSILLQYVQYKGALLRGAALVVYYVVPNLEKFNVRNAIVHHVPVSAGMVGLAGLYAGLYILILLYCAKKLLANKDL